MQQKKNAQQWIQCLSENDLTLLKEFILSDYKLTNLSSVKQQSRPTIRKNLDKIKNCVERNHQKGQSYFKDYLNLLVSESILSPSIATTIYEKYLDERNFLH